MIRIETGVISQKKDTSNILMEYEQDENVQVGEYLAILDKIKDEVLENTNIDREKLCAIIFKENNEIL